MEKYNQVVINFLAAMEIGNFRPTLAEELRQEKPGQEELRQEETRQDYRCWVWGLFLSLFVTVFNLCSFQSYALD
jgi:hypothetical protein